MADVPDPLTPEQLSTLEYHELVEVCPRCLGSGKDGGCPRCGRVHRLAKTGYRGHYGRGFKARRLEPH